MKIRKVGFFKDLICSGGKALNKYYIPPEIMLIHYYHVLKERKNEEKTTFLKKKIERAIKGCLTLPNT